MNSTRFGDHPMTGNQICHRIGSDGIADGPDSLGAADAGGNGLITDHTSGRNPQQCLPDGYLKIRSFHQNFQGSGITGMIRFENAIHKDARFRLVFR